LTQRPERIGSGAPVPVFLYRSPGSEELVEAFGGPSFPIDLVPVVQYPNGASIENIEGAVPGMRGEVRVLYRSAEGDRWQSTAWLEVDPGRDFTRQFSLTRLSPSTDYELRVEARSTGSETWFQCLMVGFGRRPRRMCRRESFSP